MSAWSVGRTTDSEQALHAAIFPPLSNASARHPEHTRVPVGVAPGKLPAISHMSTTTWGEPAASAMK